MNPGDGSGFQSFDFANGVLRDLRRDPFPCILRAWKGGGTDLPAGETHYGFVRDGGARIGCASGEFDLRPGMYFCVPGAAVVRGEGCGVIISTPDPRGLFMIGGPVERTGRLQYIDGCTDTLLIPPVVMGDPCLNLLCIPPGTRQTRHTHPSVRIGLIISGAGSCVTPERVTPLVPGTIFIIPADCEHSFHTEGDSLGVIAWHPDSDFGPTVDDHPMVNRTIVEGVPASALTHQARRIGGAGA